MHEVNAAMCLAGGILAPRFEASAARDHHVAAGCIQVEQTAPSAYVFASAQGDLSYGNVVVFEVSLPVDDQARVPSLPLWRATRLAFESREACDLFLARMSGYGDVPDDVIPMVVDATLFAARGTAGQASLLAPDAVVEATTHAEQARSAADAGAFKPFRAVDRCAGGLLGASSTMQGSSAGHARLLESVGGLALGEPGGSPVEQFASAIAVLADPSPDAATYAPVLSATAFVLSSGAMDDGFSAKALLREAERASVEELPDGSPKRQAIQKFWAFTKDVLELRRDVPEGAWSDEGGSAIARGTLLFMLNPEPEQLQAVRERMPSLGTAVHFIAGLLVGIRSGLTRMGKEVKSAREPFLAGAAFVHDWVHGQVAALSLQRTWDAENGSRGYSLVYEGIAIARAHEPADPLRAAIALALRAAGVDARFSPDTGDLSGRLGAGASEVSFGAAEAKLPAFPRQPALELWSLLRFKLARPAANALIAGVNAGAREHCVFAQVVEEPVGGPALRLSVLVLRTETAEPLREAIATLIAKASSVAPSGAKTSRRGNPRRGAPRGV
jgi:hypothetical protein